jgi:Mlc titration factor MtfA (ptsG expression regulator)
MRGFSWLGIARQNWEALNAWWDESVVRFDFTKQLNILRAFGIGDPDWRQLGWALSAGLILWLAGVAWHMSRGARPAPPDRLTRAYAALCRKLARAALPREPYQGPLAYAGALAETRPDVADAARPLLERYAELRFGTAIDDGTFAHDVSRLRIPAASAPFPVEWRAVLERSVPLYRRMPMDLRLRVEPIVRRFLKRVEFIGCNGVRITDEMRVAVAAQACLLIVKRDGASYDALRSVLIYPDEFLVAESQEDEAGVVTEGARPLSGQAFETARVILSWRDVQESGIEGEAYNVVLHEFAHHLDHSFDGTLAEHQPFDREYQALCAAVERGETTLIDPYGAEHPAEFFAVATETFFEQPAEMRRHHAQLYAELQRFYGLDPAGWT